MTFRICIEASPALQQQGGMGRYAMNLIRALAATHPGDDYAIAYNHHPRNILPSALRTMPSYISSLNNKPWRLRNALTHSGILPIDRFYKGVSLYHSTGHLLPHLKHLPTVLTLHDLIPLVMPQYHRPLNRIFLKTMFPRFLSTATAIIAVSKCTKKDAVNLLGIDPNRITVIPEGIADTFHPVSDPNILYGVRTAYGLPDTYILCVSTLEPRKNHITLLRAFEHVHTDYPHVALVIAGPRGWLYHDFLAALENSPARNKIRILGKVPESDLPAMLSAATIFAFPSLYEGFGLPPLEAMACSTAVICSNTSSLPEVVQDSALMHAPLNVAELHAALVRVLRDKHLRHDLEERGSIVASRYTWDATATATRSIYHQVLNC